MIVRGLVFVLFIECQLLSIFVNVGEFVVCSKEDLFVEEDYFHKGHFIWLNIVMS